MRWSGLMLSVVLCGALPGAGCELGDKDCTEIGCIDQASLLIGSEGAWPSGSYRLTLTFDDDGGSVDFSLPDDLPAQGAITSFRGIADVDIGLQQVARCSSVRNGDSVSQSCQPIPDRFELTIGKYATPERFSVTLTRDDERIIDETGTLTYTISRPNGPECGPACRRAQAELAF